VVYHTFAQSPFFPRNSAARLPTVEGDGVIDGDVPATDEDLAPADEDAADSQEELAGNKKERRLSWLTEMVVLVVVALVIALVVKTFVAQPFVIPTGSMENTLLVKDKVLVNKLVGQVSQIHRGDIVVFDGAGNWDPPVATNSDPLARIYRNVLSLFGDDGGQTDYIKRVIGLPGDHVVCCNTQGLVTVNGVALHESAYLYPGSAPSAIKFSVVVPPGRLWVMGDNRGDSSDSRLHDCGIAGAACVPWDRSGTIPESSVIGRAFMVIWPFSRIKMLWVPSTFGQAGLSAAARGNSELRAIPAAPELPLAAGAILGLPLTLIERRIRVRRRRRKVQRR
jgi:signal peptidase I